MVTEIDYTSIGPQHRRAPIANRKRRGFHVGTIELHGKKPKEIKDQHVWATCYLDESFHVVLENVPYDVGISTCEWKVISKHIWLYHDGF